MTGTARLGSADSDFTFNTPCLTLSAFSGTIVRQWWSMPLWPSVLACLKSVEKRQDNTQAWLYVCVDACVISTLTAMSASVLCRQGWSPRSLQGSYRAVSDVGESETFKMTDSCHPVLDQPCFPPSHFSTELKKKKKTRSTCLCIHLTSIHLTYTMIGGINCVSRSVFSVYLVIGYRVHYTVINLQLQ